MPPEPSSDSELPPAKKPRSEVQSLKDAARGWKQLRENGWGDFHQRWWGEAGQLRLKSVKDNPMLEVTSSEDVCTGLCLLRHSRGWLYVRQEYDLVYRRLWNAFADKYVPGVVLTGQGGIARTGKSYSALFIVLRRMADKRAVAFTSVDASTFLFDSSGIWRKSSSSVDPMEDFPPVITNTHRIWSLVDFESTPARRDSQAHVISERTFYIIVSSPDWPHLDNFIKRGALRWVMSPWTDEELLALFTSNAIPEYARSSLDTSGKVQTARVRYGPCPRDIIVSCRDPISIKCDLASAVQAVCDTDRIATLFINPFTPVHGVSNQIVLMRRVGDIDISRMQSDIWSTQIQSELAYKALYDRVEALGVDKVKDLMLDCRKVGPYAASLSEFLLELVALELLSGNAHHNGAFKFHHFAPMTEEGTSSESHLRQFAYSHANATATLSVTDTHRWELLQGTVPSTPPYASTLVPPTPFSCRPRSIVRYHQLDDILDILA
ncbi:hypothetical protein C8Q76DRAFT_690425 [Earliella scabrosa]|nr:hypothetical protein C8Q76DRAFT_690425 [Earliella scabrosa]